MVIVDEQLMTLEENQGSLKNFGTTRGNDGTLISMDCTGKPSFCSEKVPISDFGRF